VEPSTTGLTCEPDNKPKNTTLDHKDQYGNTQTVSIWNRKTEEYEDVPYTLFCGGDVKISGTVNIEPGIVLVRGGSVDVDVTSTGQSTLAGAGVTFFLDNAALRVGSNLQINLSAPATGPTEGVLFWGARTNTVPLHRINGGANSTLNGAIYLPNADLEMSGNYASVGGGCTPIVADTVKFTGDMSLNMTCDGTTAGEGSLFKVPVLVDIVE
jgi:hypothetical protein